MKTPLRIFISVLFLFLLLCGMAIAGNKNTVPQEKAARSMNVGPDKTISIIQKKLNDGNPITPAEKDLLTRWEATQPRSTSPLDNQGGPDAFGYAFMDNQGADTATYTWIELRGDAQATWLNATDFSSVDDGMTNNLIDIGFAFPFYGQTYSQCRIGTNGDVQFTTNYAFEYTTCLPRANSGAMFAPLATDLHLQRGGISSGNAVVGYRNFGTYWVVEFDSIGFYNTSSCPNGSLKYEAILYNTGRIKFQYNHLVVPNGCYTTYAPNIGIQSTGTGPDLVYACGQSGIFPVESLAIWFFLPNGIPQPVTNFAGSANGNTVTLTWLDPTQDTNGNPLTPDSILIFRGNTQPASQIGHVTHGAQTFVITGESQGNLTYFARVKAGLWMSSFVSTPVVVGNPSYVNNFDTDNGGWVADDVWSWGAPTNPSAPIPHSGSNMWGTGMSANYNNSVCGHLDLNLGQEVSSSSATLEFWFWYQVESGFDGCNVKVSVDEGNTWTLVTPQNNYPGTTNTSNACNPSEPAWTNSTAQPWQYAVIPLGQFLGEVPIFRFTFGSDASVTYPGFFFDDMTIWGLAPRPDGEPLPVTNFQGNAGGTNTVTFTWTDPNHDTNGNPLTPDSILIFRGDALPGSQIGHAAHGVQTVAIPNEPSGVTTYYARAKAGTYLSTATNVTVIVGSPGYGNNFDTNDGGWVATGLWEHGAPTNPSAPPAHSGTSYWGTGLSANYPGSACGHVDLNPNLMITSATATLEFWAWWSTYPSFAYDGCNIKISVDEGASWQTLEPQTAYRSLITTSNTCMPGDSGWSLNSNGWRYIVVPLGQYVNQVPWFRFTFGSYVVTPDQYPGFFFDDMTMWGVGPRPNGIPRPPTNLQGSANGNTVTLTWTDPSQDTNGNPMTPDSILIFRGDAQPGSQIAHVAGGAQTAVISGEPSGLATYCIRAKHLTYISLSTCAPLVVGNPSYSSDFEANNGGWVADGVWSWGTPTNAAAPQPHGGTHMWGTGMDANYNNNACGHLDLNPGLRVASPSASLEFWFWYQIESGYDGCNVKVSVDSGATWQIVVPQGNYPGSTNTVNTCNPGETAWTNSTAQPWQHAVLPLGQFINHYPIFRFTFGSDASVTYPGFFFDDMLIWGLAPRQAVTGHVYHLGGSNPPLSGAWVIAGTDSVQTDASGSYTLSVEPGTYTVTFRHATHCDSVVTGVVVNAGENTTVNASLRAPLASMTVSSLTILVHRTLTQTDSFGVANSGACPLHFVVSDSVTWLNQSPMLGDVDPGDTTWVRVTAVPGIMQPGDYEANIRVNCNSAGSPFIIHVDMSVLPASLFGNEIPTVFALHDNYPNPFNPVTLLPFDVPRQSQVDIVVYNVMGQEVARPVSGVYAAGRYRATFGGDGLPSGLYFVKMTAGDFHAIGKMMLLK